MSSLFVAFLFAVGICLGLQALHTAHTHTHKHTHLLYTRCKSAKRIQLCIWAKLCQRDPQPTLLCIAFKYLRYHLNRVRNCIFFYLGVNIIWQSEYHMKDLPKVNKKTAGKIYSSRMLFRTLNRKQRKNKIRIKALPLVVITIRLLFCNFCTEPWFAEQYPEIR